MSCEQWQDKIDAFVDSELTPTEARSFDEHLRSCHACSQEILARQRLKVETRLAGQRYIPRAEFERRIRHGLAPRKKSPVWLPTLATAACVLVLAFFAALTWRDRSLQKEVVTQLADQHVTTLASDHPADVLSTDSHTVKPWFAGKVPFSVDIPNLSGTEFELIGGRLVYLQQMPAAQLIFAVRKHRISVFMLRERPEISALGSNGVPVRRAGFNTQTWVEDGIRYFAISDVSPQEIHQLCDLLRLSSGS
jgi:anti-sigma factor RsiW